MPESIRFLFILILIGGIGYGSVWALAHFPPPQKDVVRTISSDRFNP